MKRFWEVLYDDQRKTMEIIGISNDDTRLTNNVCEMQRVGLKVRCQTVNISVPIYDINLSGYTIEESVYAQLLNDYQQLTKKQLKR